MPVWLTLLASVLATVGFLGGLFGLVTLVVKGKATKGRPVFGLYPTGGNGTLGLFVTWDPAAFDVKFYRFRFIRVSPAQPLMESRFTVSYENPRAEPFSQVVKMPEYFADILRDPKAKAILTIEARSTEEFGLSKTLTLNQFRRLYESAKSPPASLPPPAGDPVGEDPPPVTSLDFSELVERKKKLKALEAAANAKAAKKPAAAPAAAAGAKPVAETSA